MSTRKKTNEGAADTAAQNELEPMASGGAAEKAKAINIQSKVNTV